MTVCGAKNVITPFLRLRPPKIPEERVSINGDESEETDNTLVPTDFLSKMKKKPVKKDYSSQ